MTYDSWKLDNAEDEADRKMRGRKGWRDYRDAQRCWKCGSSWDEPREDGSCYECGSFPEDEPLEPDPVDDALANDD